jgi:hypothetical protein
MDAAAQVAETAEAVARSVLALWISGVAGVIALVAAAFTGWQAWTAHLTRVEPQRASWVFEITGDTPGRLDAGWYLRNDGGSTATDVRLELTLAASVGTSPSVRTRTAEKPIPAGERARLANTSSRQVPDSWWEPSDQAGIWVPAKRNEHGQLLSPSTAARLWDQWATVKWTDDRGKARSKRIAVY